MSSGLCGYQYLCAHTHTDTCQVDIIKNKSFSEDYEILLSYYIFHDVNTKYSVFQMFE